MHLFCYYFFFLQFKFLYCITRLRNTGTVEVSTAVDTIVGTTHLGQIFEFE